MGAIDWVIATFNEWSGTLLQMATGSLVTLQLFAITLALSIPIGFALTLAYMSKNKLVQKATGFYILVMRGTPLLLQVFFMYYGLPYLPFIGKYILFDRFTACAVAFVLNYAAYFAEIFRGGLLAVDKGQFEASKVLGLNRFQTLTKIVIPQMVRVSLPSISNEAIILVKDTALAAAISVVDLMHVTKGIVSREANILPFAIAAIFYLAMSYVLTVVFRRLEKKFAF